MEQTTRRQKQIREKLERNIHRRMNENSIGEIDTSLNQFLDPSFEEQLTSLSNGYSHTKILEGEELEHQIRKQKNQIQSLQQAIDQFRIKMIQNTKRQEQMRLALQHRKKHFDTEKEKLDKHHKEGLSLLGQQYETKKSSLLKTIEDLLEDKAKYVRDSQTQCQELKKLDKILKEQEKRYSEEIKNHKETFMALEREKFQRYEKSRVEQLKQQAIKDTEPKLLQIIKSSQLDIKNSEEKERKRLEEFKNEYKMKLQKDIVKARQKFFEEGEIQKQRYKQQIEKKNRQKIMEKEKEVSTYLKEISAELNDRIKNEERKVRDDIEEYINRNKQEYNVHKDQIQQLRDNYQAKIKKLKESVNQSIANKLQEIYNREQHQYERQIKELDALNHEKLVKGQEKIQKEIQSKFSSIIHEITTEKNIFKEEIQQKYQKKVIEESRRYDEEILKLKKLRQSLEGKIIDIQKKTNKENCKITMMDKQKYQLIKSNEQLQQKVQNIKAQLESFQQNKIFIEKKAQKTTNILQKAKREELEHLNNEFLRKQQQRSERERQLIQQNNEEEEVLSKQLKIYKTEIQNNINKKNVELKKILEENREMQQSKLILERQIEEEKKKIMLRKS